MLPGAARAPAPGRAAGARSHATLHARQQAALLGMLVQLRQEAGLDQTTLARRLGITQSEVSKFERGERALDVLRLRAWLGVLGIGFTTFADALDHALARLDAFVG